jgi:hypothetical protein
LLLRLNGPKMSQEVGAYSNVTPQGSLTSLDTRTELVDIPLAGLGQRHIVAEVVSFHLLEEENLGLASCGRDVILSVGQTAKDAASAGHDVLARAHVPAESPSVAFAGTGQLVVEPASHTMTLPFTHSIDGDAGRQGKR